MKSIHFAPVALMILISSAWAQNNSSWQIAKNPLLTRWAKDVSPDKVLPEYPRPQMVRKEWVNLNGLWDYAITAKDAGAPSAYEGKILVPFPIESALSGVKKKVDPKQRLWYRRTVTAPKLSEGGRLLLHFGAVDWEATVTVNGKPVASHKGGYDAFTADITDALKPGGEQELVVSVFDATGGYQPKGKQHLPAIDHPGGIMYTPCTGIWQTVWLEPVPAVRVESLKITPHFDESMVVVHASISGVLKGKLSSLVEVLDGDKVLQTATISIEGGADATEPGLLASPQLAISIPNAKPWSPDSPFLYGLRVTTSVKDKVVDVVDSYFGMRKIARVKDDKGVVRLMLNNKFVFQVGFLDQGFWPDGIYTAPTDEALRYDIEISKKLGMNMARKHVKVEPDRWYYWCDKLGLLVWQDMPSGGAGDSKNDKRHSDEAAQQFEKELKAMIDGRYNHPSIILWVVFNEGWGQYDTVRLTNWVKEYDPSRLANPASGWVDHPAGDVQDMHNYPGPGCPKPNDGRAAVLGEFGGLGLPVKGHTWVEKFWGYRNMADQADLTKKYVNLLRKAYALKDSAGLNAVVYTQTTDCETECNGLLTYDREVIKPDIEKIAAANRGEFQADTEMKEVVPTARTEALEWRYTTAKPADGWTKPDFDDSTWKSGKAGFGTKGTTGAIINTKWNTDDIWLRRQFTLEKPIESPVLLMYHDEDAEVYINGELATKVKDFITDYDAFEIAPAAKAQLKPGKITLAVHCRQTRGGQGIDVGIGQETKPEKK